MAELARVPVALEAAEVAAGAERLPRAGQDHGAHVTVVGGVLERHAQRGREFAVDRVAAVGAVEREQQHAVLTVTLARPERRNAIDGELAAALRETFEAAADDASVRALILTGEGRAFSAGGDLSRFERDWDPREFRHDSHRLTSLITLLERLEKPTVAAINGAVTGAGTQLALVCDVRLAATSARFIYREGRLGIIPSHGGVTRLVPTGVLQRLQGIGRR